MKLNIGCGPLYYEGEVGVDLYLTDACEVQADIFYLPFVDGSIEHIRLDHVLEHQEYRKCTRLLWEIKRVLQSGGTLKIGLPDHTETCRHFIEAVNENDIAEQVILQRPLYGSQIHAGEYHKSGWSRPMIESVLGAVGFSQIESSDEDRDEGYCFQTTAVRP